MQTEKLILVNFLQKGCNQKGVRTHTALKAGESPGWLGGQPQQLQECSASGSVAGLVYPDLLHFSLQISEEI